MQLERRRAAQVIGCTLATSMLVGFLLAACLLAGSGLDEGDRSAVETLGGFSGLATIAAIASMPFSIPGGILGGVLAVRRLRRSRGASTRAGWILRGVLLGAIVGAAWSATWILILAVASDGDEWIHVAGFAAIGGAIAGALTGSVVGACCSRVEQRAMGATPAPS